MTPNRNRIQLLVDALRSGDYAQCTNRLGVEDADGNARYCCLGVATEVAIANGVDVLRSLKIADGNYDGDVNIVTYHDALGENDVTLLTSVYTWYGFEDANPDLIVDGEDPDGDPIEVTRCASRLNDDMHWNFEQIAGAFERTFLR